jgi:lysyl-tRNA synthetase class 1
MLEVVPAEVMRYLILRDRPNQAINFDPSQKLIQIVDEFESLERRILQGSEEDKVSDVNRRNYELARIDPSAPREPVSIPFRQLTTLVQVAANDKDILKSVLKRTGYGEDLKHWDQVEELADHAWRWLNRFAPEEERMQLSGELPDAAMTLSPSQVEVLQQLADYLEDDPSPEDIHQKIYDLAQAAGIKGPEAFQAIYKALIGKQRGPRAGFFLASLDKDFVQKRFREIKPSVL